MILDFDFDLPCRTYRNFKILKNTFFDFYLYYELSMFIFYVFIEKKLLM